jgi:uncharacterized protein YbaR (Trm112 family)
VSQELLDILRCPNCVREDREHPGLLDHEGDWLICRDCDRKYPIRDDIPVMLIEEGDRFQGVPREELPDTPPPEARSPVAIAPVAPQDRQKLLLALVGLALGIGLVILVLMWLRRDEDES